MKNGVLPNKKDHRDYSYFRTFHKDLVSQPLLGSVILSQIPDEFDFDAHLTMPDQNADGLYQACTAYAQADICTDEDGKVYDPRPLYDATMKIMGIPASDSRYEKVPCDIRSSLKATCQLYGRDGYFDILDGAPFDAFDTIRLVLSSQKRTGSVGTQWPKEWEFIKFGIIPSLSTVASETPWHNYKFSGVKKINGVFYLIGKSWQGKNYGDNGLAYFSREVVNKAFSNKGVFAYTLIPKPTNPGDIATVSLPWWRHVLSVVAVWLNSLIKKNMEETHPESGSVCTPVITPSILDRFCSAICQYEGGFTPGDVAYRNNNPGDLRLPHGGSITAWGAIAKDSKNFLIFKTWQDGYNALKKMITGDASGKSHIYSPEMSLQDFFRKYAPSGDDNNPDVYCQWVCQHVQNINPSTKLKELLN